ncbi:MAG: MgtC/SapB family protein [Ignavibacteriaceae bacterium]|nr:MgtC/SapB family protein [Ignavibacteriaceae bacterium]
MNSFEWTFELRFIVALALGFLIGLERESSGIDRKGKIFAGVRTFTLISLFGFGCGWLYRLNINFMLPVGLLIIGALVLTEYLGKQKEGRFGGTSEIATLLTFVIGALALLADVWISMALGIISTLLLSEKSEIEKYVEKLNKFEFLAVLKFLLITLIVFPALPNQNYTQFNLNPAHIWQIVIMVSTIGFVGYFLMKKLGDKVGLWVSGLLGGLVSSTAVSITAGRIAAKDPAQSKNALQASMLASSVMYIRILVIVWIINNSLFYIIWWKFALLSLIGIILAFTIRHDNPQPLERPASSIQNPFELKPAMLFAVLFVLLTVVTMWVKNFLGNAGLLVLSAIVGITDIDPFILSMVNGAAYIEPVVVSAIIIAMMSNTVIKAVYFTIQAKQKRKTAYIHYGVWALLHIPLVFL